MTDHSAPSSALVDGLITAARRHPGGTEFLCNGSLDAVAATFGVHAFVVDAARDVLREPPVVESMAGISAREAAP